MEHLFINDTEKFVTIANNYRLLHEQLSSGHFDYAIDLPNLKMIEDFKTPEKPVLNDSDEDNTVLDPLLRAVVVACLGEKRGWMTDLCWESGGYFPSDGQGVFDSEAFAYFSSKKDDWYHVYDNCGEVDLMIYVKDDKARIVPNTYEKNDKNKDVVSSVFNFTTQ